MKCLKLVCSSLAILGVFTGSANADPSDPGRWPPVPAHQMSQHQFGELVSTSGLAETMVGSTNRYTERGLYARDGRGAGTSGIPRPRGGYMALEINRVGAMFEPPNNIKSYAHPEFPGGGSTGIPRPRGGYVAPATIQRGELLQPGSDFNPFGYGGRGAGTEGNPRPRGG